MTVSVSSSSTNVSPHECESTENMKVAVKTNPISQTSTQLLPGEYDAGFPEVSAQRRVLPRVSTVPSRQPPSYHHRQDAVLHSTPAVCVPDNVFRSVRRFATPPDASLLAVPPQSAYACSQLTFLSVTKLPTFFSETSSQFFP